MVHIKIIHLFQHGLSFYFLAFCDRIPVYMFKHEQAQIPQRLRGLIRHNDIVSSHTVADQVYEGGFRHNEQSVRIVEKLEKDGEGLNLTWEVRDGILNHQTRTIPHTLEGKIVRLSDKIAYGPWNVISA